MTPTGMVERSQRWSCTVATGTGSFFAATFNSSICSLLKTFFAPQSSITFTSLSREASLSAAFAAPRMISDKTGAKLLRKGSSFVRAAKKMSFSR